MSKKSIEQPRPPRSRALWWAAPALVMGASVVAFRGCSGAEPSDAREPPVTSRTLVSSTEAAALPEFARPEEAKRYRDAVVEGNQRAIGVLDEALAAAREQPDADPEQIAALAEQRAARAARLRAFEGSLRSDRAVWQFRDDE
jgi:hypothetical protein